MTRDQTAFLPDGDWLVFDPTDDVYPFSVWHWEQFGGKLIIGWRGEVDGKQVYTADRPHGSRFMWLRIGQDQIDRLTMVAHHGAFKPFAQRLWDQIMDVR